MQRSRHLSLSHSLSLSGSCKHAFWVVLWHVQNVAPAAAAARFRSTLITAALRSIWKVMARKSEKTRGEKLAENAAQQGRATCLAWPGETFSANISTDHRRSPTVTSCQLKNHDRTKCTKPAGGD